MYHVVLGSDSLIQLQILLQLLSELRFEKFSIDITVNTNPKRPTHAFSDC